MCSPADDRADEGRARRRAQGVERDAQHAALRHGLHGVVRQVHHHLVDLGRVAQHRRAPRAQARRDGYILGKARGDLVERFAHHFLYVNGHTLAGSAAAEGEDAADKRPAALARGHDAVQVAPQTRARLRGAHRHLAVAQDGAEDIVEVVRDAAGKRANRLETLRAAQFLLCSFTLSDVNHSTHKFNEMAGRAQNRMTYDMNVPDGAIRMHDAVVRLPLCLLANSRLD